MAFAYLPTRNLVQGATYTDSLSITDSNGEPINLAGGSGEDEYLADFAINLVKFDVSQYMPFYLTTRGGYPTPSGASLDLGDGTIDISLADTTTLAIFSSFENLSATVAFAELDLINDTTGEVSTYQWKLNLIRDYCRGGL